MVSIRDREPPDMMSTSEGEKFMEKRMYKGRLREFFSINYFQMRTRGRGSKKSQHFADVIYGGSLTSNRKKTVLTASLLLQDK